MSITSKSPRNVLVMAYRTAKLTLPAYSPRFSPKKFTQPQLFACLVLKMSMGALNATTVNGRVKCHHYGRVQNQPVTFSFI